MPANNSLGIMIIQLIAEMNNPTRRHRFVILGFGVLMVVRIGTIVLTLLCCDFYGFILGELVSFSTFGCLWNIYLANTFGYTFWVIYIIVCRKKSARNKRIHLFYTQCPYLQLILSI